MPLTAGAFVLSSTTPGFVAESLRTAASGSFTSETVLQSVTFTATFGVRYKISALQSVQSSVTGDLIQLRIRLQTGATLTTAGSELTSVLPNATVANKGELVTFWTTVTGLSSGQVTVGTTAQRSTGTGNILSNAASTMVNSILVEIV